MSEKEDLLLSGVMNNDLDKIKTAITQGANVNMRINWEGTPSKWTDSDNYFYTDSYFYFVKIDLFHVLWNVTIPNPLWQRGWQRS